MLRTSIRAYAVVRRCLVRNRLQPIRKSVRSEKYARFVSPLTGIWLGERQGGCVGKTFNRTFCAQPPRGSKSAQNAQSPDSKPKKAELPFIGSKTVLELSINGKTLPFPLPDGELDIIAKWFGSTERAPFLNRFEILSEMLAATYANWRGASSKPKYAVQAVNRGSGKSRLQVEWIYQALNNPTIMENFLRNNPKKDKEQFINVLYETAYMGRIIHLSGEQMPSRESELQVLAAIVTNRILQRFENCQVVFDGKTVTVDKASMDSVRDPKKAINIFNSLIDKYCMQPPYLPFPKHESTHKNQRKLVIFGLDECQYYSERSSGTLKEDLLYMFLSATGRWSVQMNEAGLFWLVTGTLIRGEFVDESQASGFVPVKSSMDNLLKKEYLNAIAMQYFGKPLPDDSNPPKKEPLHPRTANALVCLYYITLGLPRAIEIMLETTHEVIKNIEQVNQSTNMTTDLLIERLNASTGLSSALQNFMSLFKDNYSQSVLPQEWKYLDPAILDRGKELLDIRAALCLEQRIDEPIKYFGILPKKLEQKAYLVQWKKIDETAKRYTRLFLMDYNSIAIPLSLLQYRAAPSDNWQPFSISLSTLILHPNLAAKLEDGNLKGTLFEHVTAASLYARYIVAKEDHPEEPILLRHLFARNDVALLPRWLQEAKLELNGVAIANLKFTSWTDATFAELHHQGVVVIDGAASEFADIILPITIGPDEKKAFIGFQTKQGKRQNSGSLAANAIKVLQRDDFYFIGVLPRPPTDLTTTVVQKLVAAKMNRTPTQLADYVVEMRHKIWRNGDALLHQFRSNPDENEFQALLTAQQKEYEAILQKILPDRAVIEEQEKSSPILARIFTLPADAVVSPIFQSYFGFAPVFGEEMD